LTLVNSFNAGNRDARGDSFAHRNSDAPPKNGGRPQSQFAGAQQIRTRSIHGFPLADAGCRARCRSLSRCARASAPSRVSSKVTPGARTLALARALTVFPIRMQSLQSTRLNNSTSSAREGPAGKATSSLRDSTRQRGAPRPQSLSPARDSGS